jgi:hypothetical protein
VRGRTEVRPCKFRNVIERSEGPVGRLANRLNRSLAALGMTTLPVRRQTANCSGRVSTSSSKYSARYIRISSKKYEIASGPMSRPSSPK